MADHLLNLETKARPTITIDGEAFPILTSDDLSLVDHHRFQSWGREIREMLAAPDLSEAGAEKLEAMLIETTDRVLAEVPPPVRDRLSAAQRIAVLEVFTQPLRETARPKAAKKAAASRGSKPPAGASGSTAEPPNAG